MFGTLGTIQQQPAAAPPAAPQNVTHQNGYNNYLNGTNGRTISKGTTSIDLSNNGAADDAPPLVADQPLVALLQSNHSTTSRQRNGEKINDIYVNRNIGQLYGPLISHHNKAPPAKTIVLYDDMDSSYKGFYLHNNPRNVVDGGASMLMGETTKIYNAFSRQRLPYVEHNADVPIEQFVRSSALTRASKKPPAPSHWRELEATTTINDTEDDELANILG